MLFQRIKKGDASAVSPGRTRERERDVISQVISFWCHAWLRAVKGKITSGIAEQKTSWGGMWKLANYTMKKHHTNTCTHTQWERQTLKETKEIECLTKNMLFGKTADPRTNVQRSSVHYISAVC